MNAIKALGILTGSILVFMAAIAGFNFVVDSQCYYRCETIDPQRRTLNSYYRVAQRIHAFPETEVVILGSSRGETTPPLWIESATGMKTLNLSAAGSELSSKLTFLKIAQENTKLRKVIWFADYFELISETTDAKLKNTPALRRYVGEESSALSFRQWLRELQSLIDHNTLEASLYFLNNAEETQLNQGAGSTIDYKLCESSEFKGKETPESLAKEVELLYQNYAARVLPPSQSLKAQEQFIQEMSTLAAKGIEVIVVITPYHPTFLKRLKAEHADIYQRHLDWISKIETLSSRGVRVLNYFAGLPGDDGSPALWDDGVHFTCRGSMAMLKGYAVPF
ncbi:hypothetical protein [Bdellovibrio sp.]|uniref:hypothetical protein n=1 Tax=Bdellovibrio sp. TaxID=28201 RepID=UPI0039E45C8A